MQMQFGSGCEQAFEACTQQVGAGRSCDAVRRVTKVTRKSESIG
jgi:hypothetical protein